MNGNEEIFEGRKRRRSLPPVPEGGKNGDGRRKSIVERSRTRASDLRRLPKQILSQLHLAETSSNFMPGFVSSSSAYFYNSICHVENLSLL